METTAQLRGRRGNVEEAGAELILIGNGSIAQALAFQRARAPEIRVFTDPTLASYKALGMTRGAGATLNPGSVLAGFRATTRGHIQSSTQGDGWQQGGLYAVAKGGTIVYSQPNRAAGDRPDLGAALKALSEAP